MKVNFYLIFRELKGYVKQPKYLWELKTCFFILYIYIYIIYIYIYMHIYIYTNF